MSGSDSSAAEPASGAATIDPWLLWHEQRFNSSSDMPGLPKPTPGRSPMASRIGILMERRGDTWPAEIPVAPYYRSRQMKIATAVVTLDEALAFCTKVAELRAAFPTSPQFVDATPSINERAPSNQQPGSAPVSPDGASVGAIIGFVDNGCAFAHPNFVRRSAQGDVETKVLYLWNQEGELNTANPDWEPEARLFGYGAEITQDGLNAIIGRRGPETPAREMYREAGYAMQEDIRGIFRDTDWTHGTYMMDIAAGHGPVAGVAPGADVIFVQVPRFVTTENTDQASARYILDGIAYVFARAGSQHQLQCLYRTPRWHFAAGKGNRRPVERAGPCRCHIGR
jgi:hypothetical protein